MITRKTDVFLTQQKTGHFFNKTTRKLIEKIKARLYPVFIVFL